MVEVQHKRLVSVPKLGVIWVALSVIAAAYIVTRITGDVDPNGDLSEKPFGIEGKAIQLPESRTGRIQSEPFVPPVIGDNNEVRLSPKLPGFSAEQAKLIRATAALLGDELPRTFVERELSSAEIEKFRVIVNDFESRRSEIDNECNHKGVEIAKAMYEAGGWTVFAGEKTEVPDPSDNTKTIARYSSPRDNIGPDDFVMQTGAESTDGRPETRIVRLRPEVHAVWRSVVDARNQKVAELRNEFRGVIQLFIKER